MQIQILIRYSQPFLEYVHIKLLLNKSVLHDKHIAIEPQHSHLDMRMLRKIKLPARIITQRLRRQVSFASGHGDRAVIGNILSDITFTMAKR